MKQQELNQVSSDLVDLQIKMDKLMQDMQILAQEREVASEKFKEEQSKRKELLNELEDMKGKIRVYCRMRPFSKSEEADPEKYKMCGTIND
jgi:kinesin family protein C2/C3